MVDGLQTDCQEILTVPETDITIYTTPCCTDCEAIKRYLQELGFQYIEQDASLPGVAEALEKHYGFRSVPLTVIGESFFCGTFAEQKPRIDEALSRREL